MATTSLNKHSSITSELSPRTIQIDSEKASAHRQFPFRTDALLDLVMVLPVSTEMIDTKSLSHPFGTFKNSIIQNCIRIT